MNSVGHAPLPTKREDIHTRKHAQRLNDQPVSRVCATVSSVKVDAMRSAAGELLKFDIILSYQLLSDSLELDSDAIGLVIMSFIHELIIVKKVCATMRLSSHISRYIAPHPIEIRFPGRIEQKGSPSSSQLKHNPASVTIAAHLPLWEWTKSQNCAMISYLCCDLWK